MLLRSIRFPDQPDWRDDLDYSWSAREALLEAYSALHQGPQRLSAYAEAFATIQPVLDSPMATRQRIRVCYVCAMAFAAIGESSEALFWLDNALALGCDLGNTVDLLDLLYLRGSINRSMLRYSDAALDYRDYLAVLDELGISADMPDASGAPLNLDALVQLAGAEFFRGQYAEAQQVLARVQAALPETALTGSDADMRLVGATHSWFQSLSLRWRGRPQEALAPATIAADVYAQLGSPISAARGQLIVADTLLDIAAQSTTRAEQQLHASRARPYVDAGLVLVRAAGDPIGESLLGLANARVSRLIEIEDDRMGMIEHALRTAQQCEDEALLAQAFTALGDELISRREYEAARYRFRDVRHLLDGSDVLALGVWARRAEHNIWEVDDMDE